MPDPCPLSDLGALSPPPILRRGDLVRLERELELPDNQSPSMSISVAQEVVRDVALPSLSLIMSTTLTAKTEPRSGGNDLSRKSSDDHAKVLSNTAYRAPLMSTAAGDLALARTIDLHRVGLEKSFLNIKGLDLFVRDDEAPERSLRLTDDLGLLDFGETSNLLGSILWERLKRGKHLTAINEDFAISLKRVRSEDQKRPDAQASDFVKTMAGAVKRDRRNLSLLLSGDTRASMEDFLITMRLFALQFQVPGVDILHYDVMFEHLHVLLDAATCSREGKETQVHAGWSATFTLSEVYPLWKEYQKTKKGNSSFLEDFESWTKKRTKWVCSGFALEAWTVDSTPLITLSSNHLLASRFDSDNDAENLQTFSGPDIVVPRWLSSWFTTCRIAGRQGLANKYPTAEETSVETSVLYPNITPSTIGKLVRRMGLSFFLMESIAQYLPFASFFVEGETNAMLLGYNPLHLFQRVLQALTYFRVAEEIQVTILKLGIACLFLGAAQRMIAEGELEDITASLGPEFEIGLETTSSEGVLNPKFDQLIVEALKLYGVKDEATILMMVDLGHRNIFVLSKLIIIFERLMILMLLKSLNSIFKNFGSFLEEKKNQILIKKRETSTQQKLETVYTSDPLKYLIIEIILLPGPPRPIEIQHKEKRDLRVSLCDLKCLASLYIQSRFSRIAEVYLIERDKDLYSFENVPGLLVADDNVLYSRLESNIFREPGGLLDALADNVLDTLRDTSLNQSQGRTARVSDYIHHWFLRANLLSLDLTRICHSANLSPALQAAARAILTPSEGSALLDRIAQELSNKVEVGLEFPKPLFLMDTQLRRLVLDPRIVTRDLGVFDAFPVRSIVREPVKSTAGQSSPVLTPEEQLAADIKSIEFSPDEPPLSPLPPSKLPPVSPHRRKEEEAAAVEALQLQAFGVSSISAPDLVHNKLMSPGNLKSVKGKKKQPKMMSSKSKKSPLSPKPKKSPLSPKVKNLSLSSKSKKSPLSPKIKNLSLSPKPKKSPLSPKVKNLSLSPKPKKSPLSPKSKKSPSSPLPEAPTLSPAEDLKVAKKALKLPPKANLKTATMPDLNKLKKFTRSLEVGMSPLSSSRSASLSSARQSTLSSSTDTLTSLSSSRSSSTFSDKENIPKDFLHRKRLNIRQKNSSIDAANRPSLTTESLKKKQETIRKVGIPPSLVNEVESKAEMYNRPVQRVPKLPMSVFGGLSTSEIPSIHSAAGPRSRSASQSSYSGQWHAKTQAESEQVVKGSSQEHMCLPLSVLQLTTNVLLRPYLLDPAIVGYIDSSHNNIDGSLGQERWHPFFVQLREVDMMAARLVSRLPKFLAEEESTWAFKCIHHIVLGKEDDLKVLQDKVEHCNLPTLLHVSQQGFNIRIGYECFCRMFQLLMPSGLLTTSAHRRLQPILGPERRRFAEYQEILRNVDPQKLPFYQSHAWRVLHCVLAIPSNEYRMGRNLLFFKRRTWLTLVDVRAKIVKASDFTFVNRTRTAFHCLIQRRRFRQAISLVVRLQSLWRSAVWNRRMAQNAHNNIPLLCGAILCTKLIIPYKNVDSILNIMRKEQLDRVNTLFNFRSKAAIRIQAWWRGVCAQKELRKRKEKTVFIAGAEFLQAAVRMYNARMEVLEKAKSRTRIHTDTGLDLNNPKVIQATKVIQTYWRARRGKAVTKFKKLRDGLLKMIIPIQRYSAHVRVIEAIGLRHALHEAEINDPDMAKFLNKGAEERLKRGNAAAQKIQSAWRGFFMFRQWVDFQKAVWVVQTFLHTQLMRHRFCDLCDSVKIIGNWWSALKMFRGQTKNAGEWPNFLRAVSCPKAPKHPLVIAAKWKEEKLYMRSINIFLAILNRPKFLKGHKRRRLIGGTSDIQNDIFQSAYRELQNKEETKKVLKYGFESLLSERAFSASDKPPQEDKRHLRVSRLLLLENYVKGQRFYLRGWCLPLFVFLRRYCITCLARLAKGQKKLAQSGGDPLETAKKLTKELKFIVNEMNRFLGATVIMNPVEASAIFDTHDFASMIAPFEILTGHKTLFDTKRVTLERSCFELRQLTLGTSHSLIVVAEPLEAFLGLKGLRVREVPSMKEVSDVLDGQISCVFAWGANDQFQLTVEGPMNPFLLHTPTRSSKSSYLRMLPDDLENLQNKSRLRHWEPLAMFSPGSEQVFERLHGLHLVKFKWMRPVGESRDFVRKREEKQRRRAVRRSLKQSMSVKQLIQLLRENADDLSSDESSESDQGEEKRIRLHRLSREVDYTFRIVQVQAGENFSVAMTNDGKLFSWGDNTDGRCGQGRRTVLVPAPTLIEGLNTAGRKVLSYSVSLRHCMALVEDDLVFIWGSYPMIHLLTQPPYQNTFVPTQIPLWAILAENLESKLDLIRRREEGKRSLLEAGWKYEFVEIKAGDLNDARFDEHHDKNESSLESDQDGRFLHDDSEAELATEPKEWRVKREAARKKWLETRSKKAEAKSDTLAQNASAVDQPNDKSLASAEEVKTSTIGEQEKKAQVKVNIAQSKENHKSSAPKKSAQRVQPKTPSGKLENKMQRLDLPPEFELDEPTPVFHYSWKGISKQERIWLEKLFMIKKERWHVAGVKCGMGFNVIHLWCSNPAIKDLLIVWGRNESGQLGLFVQNPQIKTSAAAPEAGGAAKGSLFPDLRRLQPSAPKSSDTAPSTPKLPSLFSLKPVSAPVIESKMTTSEIHPKQSMEESRKALLDAPLKSPFFGWVPNFLILGSSLSLVSPLKIKKIELGRDFVILLTQETIGGRFLAWGGFTFVGAHLVETNSPSIYATLRISSPFVVEHPSLADQEIVDLACCVDHVCILCASGSAFGFNKLELLQKKPFKKISAPKRRWHFSVIEYDDVMQESFDVQPVLYQFRYRKVPNETFKQVQGSGYQAGLQCIYGMSETDM